MAGRIPEVDSPLDDQYAKERCSMYDDLINNHLKKGMALKEVERMVGDTPMVAYCPGNQMKCLKYSLGSCLDEDILGTLLGALSYYYYAERFFSICFDRDEKLVKIVPVLGECCEGDEENTIGCYIDKFRKDIRCWGKDSNGNNARVKHNIW